MKTQNQTQENNDQSPTNTSGQGRNAIVPQEIRGWNWGAFLLTWIWGLSHHVWVSLLSPIVYLVCVMMGLTSDLKVFTLFIVMHFIIAIMLGLKGNAWAWQKQHYNSVEEFKKRERSWFTAGMVYYWLIIIAIHCGIFLIISAPLCRLVQCYDRDKVKQSDYIR